MAEFVYLSCAELLTSNDLKIYVLIIFADFSCRGICVRHDHGKFGVDGLDLYVRIGEECAKRMIK